MTKKKLKIITTIMALVAAFGIYCHFENTVIETTEHTVSSSRLPAEFSGMKILHISDLHNASFGNDNSKLIAKVKEIKPDVIFITGDIIDSRRTDIEVADDFVRRIVEIAPVYYVPGNHEARIDEYVNLAESMREYGVNVLEDKFVELERGSAVVNIVGLADPDFEHDYMVYSPAILGTHLDDMNLDMSKFTILLSHRPEVFDFYVERGMDLVFSGHAHGGQFRIPGIGGLIAPHQGWFPKYTAGMHESGNTKMFVSRGLGNSLMPIRINNNPELVIVNLETK